jgi:malonate-semialdehyde dehydrogenase (acetylating)/methylmalonate-semialdehyde dehydrogenase
MAAKNHPVILPNADKHQVINALVGAAFGAAGQRCMTFRCVNTLQYMADLQTSQTSRQQ